MSNAERQRRFQQRHPGYDVRRKALSRQMADQGAERLEAERRAAAAAQLATAVPTEADGQLLLFPAMRPAA